MRYFPLAAILIAAITMPLDAQQVPSSRLSLERVFASPDLNGPQPRGLQLSPDGKLVTLLKPREDEKERLDLWAIDTATGAQRMLVDSKQVGTGAELSEALKMQRERDRTITGTVGIVGYDWSPDGKSILLPLDGDLYLATLDGPNPAKTRRLTHTPEGELNPAISPAGGFVSFVRSNNLYVQPLRGGDAVKVTPDGAGTVHWGEAEFVAQEEMDRRTGYWWAPADGHIAVERFDEAPVRIFSRAAIGANGTKVFDQRYPAAGTPNVLVELHVMRPDGSGKVKVDLGPHPDIYLARVNWSADGRVLYVQRQSRDQKRLDLLAVDPETGASRVILSETASTWLNLSDNFRPLADGSFLWWSEKTGHGHLYRVKDQQWTALTSGDWDVRDIVGLDRANGTLFFTGNLGAGFEQHLYSVSINRPAAPKRLTEEGWWNGVVMDKGGGRAIVSRSSVDHPLQIFLADATGRRLTWLSQNDPSAAGHPYQPFMTRHAEVSFGTIKAEDGAALYYKLMMPRGGARRNLPVFMYHYGGPGAGRVATNQWANVPLYDYLTQQGWAVFMLDNRGSPDRGKAFEDQIHLAMGTVEVEDQMAAVEWLKAQPFADPKRIMTYGWSYGGYLSLKLLEKSKGMFAATVAGAPVTDWTLYDTHYTERYLGDPRAKDSAYPAAGTIGDAGKIADPLLIIHGMADDNVFFDNTTKMMAAMQEAGVPFQSMVYPGQTHRVGGPKLGVHLWKTILGFMAEHGGPALPAGAPSK